MGRKSRKKVKRMLRKINDEDAERLADYAERLADGTAKRDGARESLAPGENNVPSYTAAADEREYESKKRKAKRADHPDDMAP